MGNAIDSIIRGYNRYDDRREDSYNDMLTIDETIRGDVTLTMGDNRRTIDAVGEENLQ